MDTKKYLLSLDGDTDELIHHLTMNGYPFGYDHDKRVLEIDADHLYETIAILKMIEVYLTRLRKRDIWR